MPVGALAMIRSERAPNLANAREPIDLRRAAVPRASLTLNDLDLFLAVAETGGFRKASISAETSQSAVSRRIRHLEDALGVSLFERRRTGARLTVAGREFLGNARGIVRDLHAAIDAASRAGVGGNGRINIGLIASLSFGPIRELVSLFASKHPDVELGFVESERSELLTLVHHRQLDVAIASGKFSAVHGDSTSIASEPIFLALPKAHSLCSRERLYWEDVRDARFIVSAAEPGPEIHEYLIKRLADLGKPPHVTRHRIGREGIMNLVGLGFGVSLVAEHWCGVAYPGVVFRPVGDENERVHFSLLWLPDNDNPALRRFVSLARVHAKRGSSPSASLQTPGRSP